MSHGPKSKKIRARATRNANKLAQAEGFSGAKKAMEEYYGGRCLSPKLFAALVAAGL